MAKRRTTTQLSPQSIRDWTLYVLRLQDNHYYIGITARKDFMRRIRQHGTKVGARVNQGKRVEEIIEIQHLGKLSAKRAQYIENEVTLQYRKQYGRTRVRGGYDIYRKTSVVPTYTPGSPASHSIYSRRPDHCHTASDHHCQKLKPTSLKRVEGFHYLYSRLSIG